MDEPRLKCAVLTDSFQYGNDSDRFGLDPFQIREVQPICFTDPMLVTHPCYQQALTNLGNHWAITSVITDR